ncbi:MAG TPA: fumarate/nitrate reduction transcriptional regulator Fnr [Acidiferrobacteraceae bacterium]|nr:fumarate/nitrate reduction transcriptional regulator Fnr [Acidiferrobacteraceae bacterium]
MNTPDCIADGGLQSPKLTCHTCRLRDLCLPIGLTPSEITRLDVLVNRHQRMRARQHLFRAGTPLEFLYAIRAGTYKVYAISADGTETVQGFYVGGEILGMDAISSGRYLSNAVALEDGEVCEIPFSRLEDLVREIPQLQRQLHRLLSQEIVEDRQMMQLLATLHADQRVTAFLLNLSLRRARLGFSPTELHLKMSREDIAHFLGLTLETVSRALGRLQNEGFIRVERRRITLEQIEALTHTLPLHSCGH